MPKAAIYLPSSGPQLRALLERLSTFGVNRVVFPAREYRSESAGKPRDAHNALYDTAPIMPRGSDGGFAERFLKERGRPRNARDT